ncbi:hypothetical protein KM043_001163 [Ampulex compressa]|nr:hypothetical protein KM043_001163 [Ampulex compressa]
MDIRCFVWMLFSTVCLCGFASGENLRICVVESVHTAKRIHRLCPKLGNLTNQVECVVGNDRFNCLRRLTAGTADFTVLEPEDVVAAAAYREYNVLVTNEMRLFPQEKYRFQMVAIVRDSVQHLWDIRGKRLCHPGFETLDDWTKPFSTYLENRIIVKDCDPSKTLLENRIASLSSSFEMACIAGPWAADSAFDSLLKSRYKNLCALCDNPAGCYSSDKYHGREGALLCLSDNVGDIAWVRLDDALEFFKNENIDKSHFNYFCPDGTRRPIGMQNPCTWITKPWPVVVARSQIAEKVGQTMSALKESKFEWQTVLGELMESYRPTPVNTDIIETPEDYLQKFPGFLSANSRASCRPSRRIQWCVASNLEERKCRWLREASFVYGIEPAISCIQESNRSACFSAVKDHRADIFVARPEELFDAKKRGLKEIMQALPKKNEELSRIVALVKYNSLFRSLRDVKGTKACFAGYGNVGWNAFVTIMRNISSNQWSCSDAKAVAKFFKHSCVFGLGDKIREVPNNLYSLCTRESQAENDTSAFDCLYSGKAEVAFVDLKVIGKKIGSSVSGNVISIKGAKYRTLCQNNTNINDERICLLTWAPLSSVIAHENITDVRRQEIYLALLEMDQLFGQTFNGQTPAFSLYGNYDSMQNIVFPVRILKV